MMNNGIEQPYKRDTMTAANGIRHAEMIDVALASEYSRRMIRKERVQKIIEAITFFVAGASITVIISILTNT